MRRALAAAAASAALAAPAAAALPPAWERLAELLPGTVAVLERVRPLAPADVPARRLLRRCEARVRAALAACLDATPPPRVGCGGLFLRATRALATRPADDPGALAALRDAAEAASRVGILLREVGRARPCRDAPPGGVPVTVALAGGDGSALLVQPAAPLAQGARWRFVADLPVALRALAPPIAPDGRLAAAPVELPADAPAALRRFAVEVTAEAARAPGVAVRPIFRLALAARVAAGRVRARRLRFEPAGGGPGIATGGTALDAVAARARTEGAAVAPAHVVAPGTPEAAALGLPAAPSVATWLAGRLPRPGGEVPYVVALPAPRAPLVVLLHGHLASAAAFLASLAEPLAAAGLGAVAFDLPGHGARAGGPPFLDVAHPAALAAHMTRAVGDAVALVAALRSGAALPSEVRPRVAHDDVRLLGYSLGGMLGTLVLGVEPALGAAVLVAPAGDLTDWIGLRVARALAIPLLRCAGGPTAGTPCEADARCGSGGLCLLAPEMHALAAVATHYRTVVVETDPEAWAARAAGTGRRRPVLIQAGGADFVVLNANTEGLAAAMRADPRCRQDPAAPQTLCRFPDADHALVEHARARAQAVAFLARGGAALDTDATLRAR